LPEVSVLPAGPSEVHRAHPLFGLACLVMAAAAALLGLQSGPSVLLLALSGGLAGAAVWLCEPWLIRMRLGAKAHTHRPSSWRELILLAAGTGLAFAILGERSASPAQTLITCAYIALLTEIALIDLHTRLILNFLTYPSVGLALVASLAWSHTGPLLGLAGVCAGVAVFGILEVASRGGIARGDTKLAGLIGAMRGFPGVFGALIVGIIVGGLMAAGLLASGKDRKATFAYGPALSLGAIISLVVAAH
jgi:leader peptidase (prepilin peptidase)/N-methyltransferase